MSISRTETAEQILDLAEMLIQSRSYSAFSYQDIADQLGIKKASIHYHFPSKAALGEAVITRYAQRLDEVLTALLKDDSKTTLQLIDIYAQPYLQFSDTPDRVCLCGALAGEIMALPEEMRGHVERFFKTHQAWLTKILERGVKRKELELAVPAAKLARMVFGAMQGALLVKRATGDMSQMKDVLAVLKTQLQPPAKRSRKT